jgi:hypothetical protein
MPAFSNRFIFGLLGALAALGALFWLIESRNHWRDQAKATQASFDQTVLNYRTAAAQARKADADNKAKVEADQRAINESTAHEYEARIAAVRARYERLQPRTGTVASGPRATPVSVVSNTPSGANPAPAQDGLSADDRLTATEQAIQLEELIKWVNGQTAANAHP